MSVSYSLFPLQSRISAVEIIFYEILEREKGFVSGDTSYVLERRSYKQSMVSASRLWPALTAGQRRCHLLSPAQRPPAEVLERFSFPIHGASFPTSYSTVDFWSGTFSGCKLWSTVLCSSLVSTVDLRYRPAMLVTARRCISSLPK